MENVLYLGGLRRETQYQFVYPKHLNPVTETWQDYPVASVDSVYHQVSRLLSGWSRLDRWEHYKE